MTAIWKVGILAAYPQQQLPEAIKGAVLQGFETTTL